MQPIPRGTLRLQECTVHSDDALSDITHSLTFTNLFLQKTPFVFPIYKCACLKFSLPKIFSYLECQQMKDALSFTLKERRIEYLSSDRWHKVLRGKWLAKGNQGWKTWLSNEGTLIPRGTNSLVFLSLPSSLSDKQSLRVNRLQMKRERVWGMKREMIGRVQKASMRSITHAFGNGIWIRHCC